VPSGKFPEDVRHVYEMFRDLPLDPHDIAEAIATLCHSPKATRAAAHCVGNAFGADVINRDNAVAQRRRSQPWDLHSSIYQLTRRVTHRKPDKRSKDCPVFLVDFFLRINPCPLWTEAEDFPTRDNRILGVSTHNGIKSISSAITTTRSTQREADRCGSR